MSRKHAHYFKDVRTIDWLCAWDAFVGRSA